MTVRPYNPQQAPDDAGLAKEHQNQEARAIQASIKSAKDATDKLTTDATALTTRVTTAEGNITTLNGQMTTANGNISTLQGQMTTVNTTIGELSGTNRLINGDFRIDQRNAGASQTVTAAAALAYCLDRWYAYCTGANTSVQQVLVNNKARLRFTGAASVTGIGLGQRIEATNSADLAGQSVMLQAKLSSSSLTTVSWALYYATTTNTFGTLASPTRTSIASGSWTITSTEALYTAAISVPSGAYTGLELVITAGALLASQTLTIGDVQLEYGTVATLFERLQYGTQLLLCHRYYYKGSAHRFLNFTAATANVPVSIKWPTTMFAIPVVTWGATTAYTDQDQVTGYMNTASSTWADPSTTVAVAEIP